ncbi:hypothetical protein ACIP3A_39425 [Streptomyces tricolor]|uniref:hypothetical protein n=1 Tax=Streptomyces tricolor TaxID=68277 RepID=UPI0038006F85
MNNAAGDNDRAVDNGHAGDNAPFFFDRYPSQTAQWLAGLGDEASAKAGDSAYDFRRILCEMITMGLHDGIGHAFIVAPHFIAPNSQAAKYLAERYDKYDQARSAVIETGRSTDSATTGQQEKPVSADGADSDTAPDKSGQDSPATTGQSTASTGASAGQGPTITVAGGCGSGRTAKGEEQNTGIGHQGTLFVITYNEWRASISSRRESYRKENKRLINIAEGTNRQIARNNDELNFLDLAEAADRAGLENLVNTHRDQTSIAGVLRAAEVSPQDLGLTDEAVTWLDTQLKAM